MLIEVSDTKIIGVPQSMYRMDEPEVERPWIVVMDSGAEYGLTDEEFAILKAALIDRRELLA